MAVWIAKVEVRCSSGRQTAKLIGPSAAEAIRKGVAFNPKTRGASCVKGPVAIVQRGSGAGARDPYESENPFAGARRRKKRKKARRRR